ncbi:hypothetical protein K469DRAFT_692301 [Zopfia rhizophila CBS 207.26]|uniref:GED domain-containing protein n=1 Tax=Zopfia rhizophila CBS 207.26 TaxID=1314779 RepID=A0A6A6DRP8_9PEZI|nr:hypothetical protein K469DRAFT_692301 [Zopfia rhizophila CBS 207.26]
MASRLFHPGPLDQLHHSEQTNLLGAIEDAIEATQPDLAKLGSPRDTEEQQRAYLIEKAQIFQRLTHAALRGDYRDPFFKLAFPESNVVAHLRTEIQNLNIAFAYVMHHKGHSWTIADDQVSSEVDFGNLPIPVTDYDAEFEEHCNVSRTTFLEDRIELCVSKNCSSGLRPRVNLCMIGDIFRLQSRPWKSIAEFHIQRVFRAIKDYVEVCMNSIMDARTTNLLLIEEIGPELDNRRKLVEVKLEELLLPYNRQYQLTYDPSFIREIDKIGTSRHAPEETDVEKGEEVQSAEKDTNLEVSNLVQTYYNRTVSVFIDNVANLAIENCIVADLANIFSPERVSSMDKQKLQIIASESEEVLAERSVLKQKLEDLNSVKQLLKVEESAATAAGQSNPQSTPSTPTIVGAYPFEDEAEHMPRFMKTSFERLFSRGVPKVSRYFAFGRQLQSELLHRILDVVTSANKKHSEAQRAVVDDTTRRGREVDDTAVVEESYNGETQPIQSPDSIMSTSDDNDKDPVVALDATRGEGDKKDITATEDGHTSHIISTTDEKGAPSEVSSNENNGHDESNDSASANEGNYASEISIEQDTANMITLSAQGDHVECADKLTRDTCDENSTVAPEDPHNSETNAHQHSTNTDPSPCQDSDVASSDQETPRDNSSGDNTHVMEGSFTLEPTADQKTDHPSSPVHLTVNVIEAEGNEVHVPPTTSHRERAVSCPQAPTSIPDSGPQTSLLGVKRRDTNGKVDEITSLFGQLSVTPPHLQSKSHRRSRSCSRFPSSARESGSDTSSLSNPTLTMNSMTAGFMKEGRRDSGTYSGVCEERLPVQAGSMYTYRNV